MPYISIEAGKLTAEVKESLIAKLTAVSAEIMGIPKEFFFVSIHENADENLAIAGKDVATLKKEFATRNDA